MRIWRRSCLGHSFPAAWSPGCPLAHSVAKEDAASPVPPDWTSDAGWQAFTTCAFYEVLGSTPGLPAGRADGLCTGRQHQVPPQSFNCMSSLTSRHFPNTNWGSFLGQNLSPEFKNMDLFLDKPFCRCYLEMLLHGARITRYFLTKRQCSEGRRVSMVLHGTTKPTVRGLSITGRWQGWERSTRAELLLKASAYAQWGHMW